MHLALAWLACAAAAPEPEPAALNEPSAAPVADPVAARLAELSPTLPPGFTALAQPPSYVVIGDLSPAEVRRTSEGLVAWSHTLLRQDLFTRDPEGVVDIWLFSDAAVYEREVKRAFGEAPSTPYGFANDRGLYMNIGTGGGTLVHELVHPLVAADLPGAPPWVNEGLASLFEACAERDGHIVGLLNWRLPGLQEAIAAGALPTFRALASQDAAGFYDNDPGSNYGQARYLMMYLQERGLLRPFVDALREGLAEDPTGYTALEGVLGQPDMAAFQREWEAWVMAQTWGR